MDTTGFLASLHRDGFMVSAVDSRLRVTPAARLTPALRAGITAHKTELLRLLSGPASDEPAPGQYADWREQIMAGLRRLRDQDQAEFYALCEEIAERAGIMEFDGGLDRDEAERRAEWETCWLRFCAPQAATHERMAA